MQPTHHEIFNMWNFATLILCLQFSHLVKVGTSITLKKYHAIDEEISIM
jgi:hypothetical protein